MVDAPVLELEVDFLGPSPAADDIPNPPADRGGAAGGAAGGEPPVVGLYHSPLVRCRPSLRPSASLLLVARGGVGGRCLVLPVGGGCGGHRQAIRGRDRPSRHAGGGAGAEAAAAFRISELFEVWSWFFWLMVVLCDFIWFQ